MLNVSIQIIVPIRIHFVLLIGNCYIYVHILYTQLRMYLCCVLQNPITVQDQLGLKKKRRESFVNLSKSFITNGRSVLLVQAEDYIYRTRKRKMVWHNRRNRANWMSITSSEYGKDGAEI